MNKLNRQLSLFSVLALVAFEPQNLQATSSSSSVEEIDFQKPQKSLTSESFDVLQDTLQKIKDGQYVSTSFLKEFASTHFEELKQFESKITPGHEMFDSWIRLILEAFFLKAFPENIHFDNCLKIAKERGEHEQASPAAQYNLGIMYECGKGVNKDLTKTLKYYQLAADQGYASAQNNLGYIYFIGKGVNQNFSEAFKYYEKAADQEDAKAQNSLGIMYECGITVNRDFSQASKYYKKSADQGYAYAQLDLGLLYYHGKGVNQDFTKAFEYYQKAAEQEDANTQYHLASMYQNGQGVDRDLVQSFKWYLKSAKNKCTIYDLKINLKSLVTFVPSTITIQDVVNLINNQETLTNNIEASIKKSKFAVPSLFKNYSEIVDFEDILLKSISTFVQSGFMVTCLQPNDVKAFKSSNCPDIKYYEVRGQSFLTFGQDNIAAADKWMTIFDQSHPVYGAISDILGTLTEIHKSFETEIVMSDVARTLENQYILLLILNQNLDTTHTLTPHQQLVKKVEQDIEVLTQLQAIPQQLTDLLTKSAPVRNRLFLQNNEHIEPIFKD